MCEFSEQTFGKILLAVQRGCQRKLVSVTLNFGEFHLSELNASVKESFNISEPPIYVTHGGCEIKSEDIMGYVKQFMRCPCFVLNIKDTDVTKRQESCSLVQQGLDIPLAHSRRLEFYCETENMIDNIFNNLETKEELLAFMNAECKFVCQSFAKTKKLTDSDRLAISKSIIRQLLNISPNRMLQRFDFEQLADWISEIFAGEKAETYYRKFTNGKIASGKLYDAYTNQRKKLAKCGIIKRRSRNNKNLTK